VDKYLLELDVFPQTTYNRFRLTTWRVQNSTHVFDFEYQRIPKGAAQAPSSCFVILLYTYVLLAFNNARFPHDREVGNLINLLSPTPMQRSVGSRVLVVNATAICLTTLECSVPMVFGTRSELGNAQRGFSEGVAALRRKDSRPTMAKKFERDKIRTTGGPSRAL